MFEVREAIDEDNEFLFELKKAAEYEPVKAVFGWEENAQQEIHRNEWNEAKPTIIEIEGAPVGSYLVQAHPEHLYFGRFFLLPACQGKGIGNRVGQLYERFGFEVASQDEQFVHMLKPRL
ncbi:GNAT family N-acetyltransferase [Vibrio parahaemolyticus]|uniref:GNAT family N-acetyltransferase n=1 Tax=Vibrio parahaemolyticus TaxID=670 RepID=UPI0013758766|nr:GNAT family N-acetyltransferase [Vibrio parahaemolyticus]NCM79682.1 GNAT family N-acetyltransferase [Vibrio parahaemolyticus]